MTKLFETIRWNVTIGNKTIKDLSQVELELKLKKILIEYGLQINRRKETHLYLYNIKYKNIGGFLARPFSDPPDINIWNRPEADVDLCIWLIRRMPHSEERKNDALNAKNYTLIYLTEQLLKYVDRIPIDYKKANEKLLNYQKKSLGSAEAIKTGLVITKWCAGAIIVAATGGIAATYYGGLVASTGAIGSTVASTTVVTSTSMALSSGGVKFVFDTAQQNSEKYFELRSKIDWITIGTGVANEIVETFGNQIASGGLGKAFDRMTVAKQIKVLLPVLNRIRRSLNKPQIPLSDFIPFWKSIRYDLYANVLSNTLTEIIKQTVNKAFQSPGRFPTVGSVLEEVHKNLWKIVVGAVLETSLRKSIENSLIKTK